MAPGGGWHKHGNTPRWWQSRAPPGAGAGADAGFGGEAPAGPSGRGGPGGAGAGGGARGGAVRWVTSASTVRCTSSPLACLAPPPSPIPAERVSRPRPETGVAVPARDDAPRNARRLVSRRVGGGGVGGRD